MRNRNSHGPCCCGTLCLAGRIKKACLLLGRMLERQSTHTGASTRRACRVGGPWTAGPSALVSKRLGVRPEDGNTGHCTASGWQTTGVSSPIRHVDVWDPARYTVCSRNPRFGTLADSDTDLDLACCIVDERLQVSLCSVPVCTWSHLQGLMTSPPTSACTSCQCRAAAC